MANIRATSTAVPRVLTLLISAFSLLALTLTAVGLYGVVAYGVSQREREFGIRTALGAPAPSIRRLVVKQGLALTLLGLALGGVGVVIGGRLIAGMLYGVLPTDPVAVLTSAGLLTAVATLAAWLPARRATRVDPVVALRAE